VVQWTRYQDNCQPDNCQLGKLLTDSFLKGNCPVGSCLNLQLPSWQLSGCPVGLEPMDTFGLFRAFLLRNFRQSSRQDSMQVLVRE